MYSYPLFERFGELPVAGLIPQATPVQALAGAWLKRDDLSAADYGGNKIRKLDFLLADVKRRGLGEIVTFGYAGSNFVAATAWHGRKLGLHTNAYLLPQINAGYVADNLGVGLHCGAELKVRNSTAAVVSAAALDSAGILLRSGKLPAWIPPGGSSPLGVMGFINAALELQGQIRAGQLPEPEIVYVAFSSMGTVAGLALGFELAQMRTRIVAVQVVEQGMATAEKLRRLAEKSERLLGLSSISGRALARVQIRPEYFGAEYGRPTDQTKAAIERFSTASGARADSAYSGKALACFYDDLDHGRAKGPTLFWHTFNSHALPGVQRPAADSVPPALRRYFPAQ